MTRLSEVLVFLARQRAKIFAGAVTFLALPACDAGRHGEAGWQGTVRDSADVTIVENAAEGIWTEASRWDLDEDLRVGTVETNSLYQFGDIVGIGVGPEGRLFVLDLQADHPLRVFDADGEFLRGQGSRGSGPGEFQGGAGPVFVAGDSLVVIPDHGNARVNLFDTDGAYLRSIPVTMNELVARWGTTSQGIPVLQLGLSTMPGMEQTDDLVDVLLAIGKEGTRSDTLLTVPSSRQMFFRGGSPELTFFAPEPWWVIGPDDVVWMGTNDRYVIGSYQHGVLRRLTSLPHVPVAVSERDREIVLDAWIRIFEQRMPNADAMLRQLAQFHDVFPAYQQFLLNSDGTLWVQQVQIPSTLTDEELAAVDPTKGWGSRTWDVFDAEGRYFGAVEFPDRFELMALSGDHAYGVWRDEMDVPFVMRLRIAKSS